MDRRRYLAGTLSALTGTALVAGCLDDFSPEFASESDGRDRASGDDTTADDAGADGGDDGGSDTDSDRENDREIDRAVGRLNKASISLSMLEDELDDPEAIDFDHEEPRELIAAGREHLETASATEIESYLQDIEVLEGYADVLERMSDVTETVTDESLRDEFEEISTAIEDRDLEVAQAGADDYNSTFANARDRLDPALETIETIDRNRLEDRNVVDFEDIESGARALDDVVSSFSTLGGALDSIILGHEYLEDGETKADDNDHEGALVAFEGAKEAYTAAETTLEDGKGDAPDGLVDTFETSLCQTGHLTDATGYFIAASEAALAEDPHTAEEKRAEAEAALEATQDCA